MSISHPNGNTAGARTGVRQRSRATIEKRILDAAEGVFAESGFSGATTAEIAKRAHIPKANLHYYFRTKEELYQRVLTNIIEFWLRTADLITPQADPGEALTHYIEAKILASRDRPLASRVFANEIIHGAPMLTGFLSTELKQWVDDKSKVIQSWIVSGKMRAIDPRHLFFMIWAATQTYADFASQIGAVMGKSELEDRDYKEAARQLSEIVLRGCGIVR